MMKDDGGSAFPCEGGSGLYPDSGMSLRDWFAGQALAGLLADSSNADCGPKGYAHDAYLMADAMLAARKEGE